MTAKELLELLRNEKNVALLRDIIMVSLGSMQPAYREDTIYMADLKYLHQGPIYVAEDVTYKTKYYFKTIADVVRFLRRFYPKADRRNIYRAIDDGNVSYGFTITKYEHKELVLWLLSTH